MTIRPLLAAATLAFALSAGVPALAADVAKGALAPILVSVNGKAIPQARADAMMATLRSQGQPESDELEKIVRDGVIRLEILSQAAARKGTDRVGDVQAAMVLASQNVLVNAYLEEYAKTHPISDAVVRKEYDAIRAMLGDKEYRIRHIMVADEGAAKQLIARLGKGERFEDLARESSQDPDTRDKGGDLGWASPSAYVPSMARAMVMLEKGQYTESPVQSGAGWHVIRLEGMRYARIPSFEEAKGELVNRLREQAVQQHIDDLVKAAKVN